jgi:hypothetical protein
LLGSPEKLKRPPTQWPHVDSLPPNAEARAAVEEYKIAQQHFGAMVADAQLRLEAANKNLIDAERAVEAARMCSLPPSRPQPRAEDGIPQHLNCSSDSRDGRH